MRRGLVATARALRRALATSARETTGVEGRVVVGARDSRATHRHRHLGRARDDARDDDDADARGLVSIARVEGWLRDGSMTSRASFAQLERRPAPIWQEDSAMTLRDKLRILIFEADTQTGRRFDSTR